MRKAYWRRLEIKRFIEEDVRTQSTLLPETLDDYVADDNPVRAIDAFVGQLDLLNLGFDTAVITSYSIHYTKLYDGG